jgi:hypothetical protein
MSVSQNCIGKNFNFIHEIGIDEIGGYLKWRSKPAAIPEKKGLQAAVTATRLA